MDGFKFGRSSDVFYPIGSSRGQKISQAALSWHDDSLKMISLVTTLCAVYNSTLEL
jgi:hypothetical protein